MEDEETIRPGEETGRRVGFLVGGWREMAEFETFVCDECAEGGVELRSSIEKGVFEE